MPTAQDQIALNESANQANEQYVTGLITRASRGEQLRQEELEALIDYKAAKNREIRINDLIQRGATGKLDPREIEELKNYRNNVTAQQPADLSNIPAIYREGAQSVALSDTRRLTGQDKVFAKAFGKIGPIADVQISEVQGDTPLLRLVDKIYGSENWTLEGDKVLVKPKGQTDYLPLPIEDPVSTLQRTGISAGLGAGGELVGSLAIFAVVIFESKILTVVTALLSIVQVAPELDTVISPLSPSVNCGTVCHSGALLAPCANN